MTEALVMAKSPHYFTVAAGKVVQVQLVASAYSSIKTEVGADTTKGAGDDLVGKGRQAAVLNGCFSVKAVYNRAATGEPKYQTASIIIAPSKADTAVAALVGKNYRTFPIIEIRPVRRRIYVF